MLCLSGFELYPRWVPLCVEKIIRSTHFRLGFTILQKKTIERFHSRRSIYANLLEFTKEMFCIRKEFNSHRVGLLGRRLIVLEQQNGRRVVMVRNSQDGLLPRKQSLRIIFFLL